MQQLTMSAESELLELLHSSVPEIVTQREVTRDVMNSITSWVSIAGSGLTYGIKSVSFLLFEADIFIC